MSSTAAHLLSRTATPYAAAQATRRRLEANAGFDKLVDDEADPTSPAAAGRPGPEPSARSRAAGSANGRDTPANVSTTSSGSTDQTVDAAPGGMVAPLPTVATQGAVPPQPPASKTAAGPDGAFAAAAPLDPNALPTPLRPASQLQDASSGGGLPGLEAEGELDEGGAAADGTATPASSQAQGANGAAIAATAAVATPGGSAAQPLLAAVSGTGATLVKAQGGATGAALRAGAATLARGKASAAAPAAKAADTSGPLAVPEAPVTPLLLAAVANDTGNGDSDDDAEDDDGGSNTADATAGATGAAAFVPLASPTSPTASPTTAAATPLSASAADLAAQMAAKVVAGSSRFQLQLNPLGLGRVDVSVSIGSDRQLTAALSFADPQTASALSAHSGELKTALEQAGFNVPVGGFDFTSSAAGTLGANLQGGFDPGSNSGGGFGDDSGRSGASGRMAAFGAGEALAAGANTTAWTVGGDSRLDIRI